MTQDGNLPDEAQYASQAALFNTFRAHLAGLSIKNAISSENSGPYLDLLKEIALHPQRFKEGNSTAEIDEAILASWK